ncbi:MAG: nickel-dependent lactate racemase [Chloroflexi bacterium]|nr:nickel-dependent lactate racemase [Chloroflexota bacterium]
MSTYHLPYAKTQIEFAIPDSFQVQVLKPAPIPPASDPTRAVNDALDNVLGNVRLSDYKNATSVAIAINDKTRPVPLKMLLPPLLQYLTKIGIADYAITLIVAVGTHAPMAKKEFADLLPAEILARYHVITHDCDDRANLVHLGETSRGTPVWCNRLFARADLRISIGNLEPHQFMGFSGGVKTAAVGLGGRETVTRNHSMMLDPHANIARYDDNPARQDVEEIGKMIGVHFALNSIINENKQIVAVLAGDPREVMKRGIPMVLDLYEAKVEEPFDLVITSPGGHPKDINLYQAQKALAHATFVTKENGTVILCAACPEGTGSSDFEKWMADKTSHAQVIETFKREGYHIGAHKAFQISRDAIHERVLFVTEMETDFVSKLLLTRRNTIDDALSIALRDLPLKARIGILPYANATIPVLVRK